MPGKLRCGGSEITGVVLAGGLSSRLGHDKAGIRLAHGDEPDFLARAAGVLAACCRRVIVVGRTHPDYESYADALPGQGPAGGIATALEVSSRACLVLSCDLPFMEQDVLERLIACRAARPAAALVTAYRQKDTGHVEALVAIYEKEALPCFRAGIGRGELKISLAVPLDRQHFLEYTADESLPFFNVNYPADLLVARKIMRMLGR
jgi:molybdopterin-guanine dinucleotide biosynthesis protein A